MTSSSERVLPSPWMLRILAILAVLTIAVASIPAIARPLTIDDVLAIQTVDRAAIDPGSPDIAIAMPRPVATGEVYGRNAYAIDPSRNDIWLVRRDGTDLRPLTQGQADAAGYWCPYWSPDGQRLAMLSTAPEGDEPRGGDNVRLYVWERGGTNGGSGTLRRLSDRAVRAQERFGSALGEADIRGPGARSRKSCREYQENAPFVWLDTDRLLAVLMPQGEQSPMLARYPGVHREAARAGTSIREGQKPTVSRSVSGLEAGGKEPRVYEAELVIFDLASGTQTSLGAIPAFPVYGALTIALSPDARRAAILAPRRAIAPHRTANPRLNFGSWMVEKRLFVVDLEAQTPVESIALPTARQYPVDVVGWSPNSERFAFRARSDTRRNAAALWALEMETGAMMSLTPGASAGSVTTTLLRPGSFGTWAGDSLMRVYVVPEGAEDADCAWQLVDVESGESVPFATEVEGFDAPVRLPDGTLAANSDAGLVRFDPSTRAFVPWPSVNEAPCDGRNELFTDFRDGAAIQTLLTPSGPQKATITLSAKARILDHDCTGIVYFEEGEEGSSIRFAQWGNEVSNAATLMRRDAHLAQVSWGERRMIDYTHEDGSAQKMAVLFPPDYDASKPYPTLFWVYGRYSPRSVDSFELDRRIFAPHNLHVFAAQGYIVVTPSIPIPRGDTPSEPFAAIPRGVLPALDELIRLGITDEARVGVMGHSFGGYTVNALVAQTDRFAAAVSMAGASDLATNHASFDPTARGWPGIEQDFYVNDGIYEYGFDLRADPGVDPALYHRNSPLTHVDAITTPLMLIHGELDIRAQLNQPEALYSLLRRRGRTARLLRYWGENHSLANSPANAKDMMEEMLAWFDRYVRKAPNTEE